MVNFLEKRIVTIEDEDLSREILHEFFTWCKFTNFHIYRCAEDFLRTEPDLRNVDLLITDHFLPGMNGINLINFLRMDLGLNFPVFIFSAIDFNTSDIPREMILKKPIHLEYVFERIKSCFEEGEKLSFA